MAATQRTCEQRSSPNKGYGLYARQNIQRGTIIFEEDPLVATPPNTNEFRYLREALEKLTAEQRNAYYQLHFDHQKAGADQDEKAISIFDLNNVTIGSGDAHGCGVFRQYSRLNHSCTPNVDIGFGETEKLTVRAIRTIRAGEELTTTYINAVQGAEQRARALRHWGFECKCSACDGENAASSNKRRLRMSSILNAFKIMRKSDEEPVGPGCKPMTPAERLRWAEELVKLHEQEGLVGRELRNAYTRCTKWAIVLDRRQEATAFARKAMEIHQVCSGESRAAEAHIREQRAVVEEWLLCEAARYFRAR